MSTHDPFDGEDDEFVEENNEENTSSANQNLTHKNKSDSYQYRIIEIAIDPFLLSDFPNDEGFGAQISTSGYSEEITELRKQLMKEVKRLMKTVLTKRQAQVMNLRLQGKTQVEIGQKLGIHQTTVHKTISGVIDYKNGGACYGGAIKKLRKLCLKDEKILIILKKIEEAYTEENDDF